MPDPQLIRVKKYPNRRLYDGSRSRHLTHEELYDLVVAGRTVSVTDSRTGADITNLVLMQALLERSPEKLAAFPPEVSHLLIRAGEQMLRSVAHGWLSQLVGSMAPMTGGMPMPFMNPFGAMPSGGSARPEEAPPGDDDDPPEDELAALREKVDLLTREMAAIKAGKRPAFGRKKGER